jgi:glycosyltransferase involved in cell wall biosynthesis
VSAVPILFVIPRVAIGGTPRHLLEVLGHLDRTRFTPAVYCLKAGPESAFLARLRALGVEVLDGRTAETFRGLRWVPAVLRLAALLRRRRIPVVQSYLLHANFLASLAGRLARVPVVVTSVRSLDVYAGHERVVARLSNRLADRVMVCGEAVRRHVHQAEGCPLEKLAVVPNGVDLARVARPASAAWPAELAGVPIVGAVGRLAPKKAQGDLLDAVPHVVDRVPAARVVLVGDGPDRAALEARARALGVAERVRFLGAVGDAETLMARLDVFVLPSRLEGMSNALLEAMAAGRPVVATDVGANAELVVDGVTGFVVPPARPDRLAEAIVTLLKDPERARVMGAAGRARVAEAFTVERMVERLQRLYDDRLAVRRGRRG